MATKRKAAEELESLRANGPEQPSTEADSRSEAATETSSVSPITTPTDDNREEVNGRLLQLQAANDSLNEALTQEREAWIQEREAWTQEREAWTQEREALAKESINLRETKRALSILQDATSNNPFALILIDGDGCIFSEPYWRQGLKGGELAAQHIWEKIHNYFNDNGFEGESGWQIVVRMFLNLEGLANRLRIKGWVPEKQQVRLFATGFNQNQPLFEMVDVGFGKEVTDSKLRTLFEHYAPEFGKRCKHIVLSCSNDHGYITMLNQYKHNMRQVTHTSFCFDPRSTRLSKS